MTTLRPRLTVVLLIGATCALVGGVAPAAARTPRVLRVGSWHGSRGQYRTIDAAVAAAHAGDWILVGPGDYHPRMDYQHDQLGSDFPAAVLVKTPDLHLRGMDRNKVVIDGTKPGSPPCSSKPADQDYGAVVHGKHQGRNGVEALFSDADYFENFTVCNFLTGTADTGNEIWWNGGDDGGKIGLGSWWGNYLSATSTFFDPHNSGSAAQYGIFVSNSRGPGSMNWTYASNMNDSSYYIGACPDCNAVIDHGHAENSALGLSSTNAGGHLVIENTIWDKNKTGMVSNSQNDADPPTPQNGACPGTATKSCTIWRNNQVYDNNNPNVPFAGTAALGPVGTGMVIAGTRNMTLEHNHVYDNGAWGILVVPFPDTGGASPENISNCHGGAPAVSIPGGQPVPCLFDVFTNHIVDNTLSHNGFFGNATNGDIADLSYGPPPEDPTAGANCYHGNTDSGGLTTTPTLLQTVQSSCSSVLYPNEYSPAEFALLLGEAACATSAFGQCPAGIPKVSYPQTTTVKLLPLPKQRTMPDPCKGVPVNPWCPQPKSVSQASSTPRATASAGGLAATGSSSWLPVGGVALLAAAAICGGLRRRRS